MSVGSAAMGGRSRFHGGRPAGITLVELLVVVAIVAVLVGLLLPAVQAARESARMAQCRNNLAQMAKGFASHEQSVGTFPSGGWGVRWVGDADRGLGPSQPGGWIYSLLPFVEQQPLWNLPGDGQPGVVTDLQKERAAQLVATPLPFLHCPSRRPAKLYAAPGFRSWGFNVPDRAPNPVARTDYCASAGSRQSCAGTVDPIRMPEPPADSPRWLTHPANTDPRRFTGDGVVYQHSGVRAAHVRDGLSYTIVAGEKYLSPLHYQSGLDNSDNENAYVGDDKDVLCNCSGPTDAPRRDSVNQVDAFHFGSAHVHGSHYAFGDGSVRSMSYDVDVEMLRRMVVRNDRLPVEIEP